MKVDIRLLEEPSAAVLAAMAAERTDQLRRNGHGEHAYRDLWLAGVKALRDSKTTDFRNYVEAHGGTFERLPDASFAQSGTAVHTCIVTIPAA